MPNNSPSHNPTPRGGYTLFSTYHRCHRQFYFRYIRRWIPAKPNQKAAWGRVLHATTVDFYDRELPQDPASADYWEARASIYDRHVAEEGLTEIEFINRGYTLLEKWQKEILPMDSRLEPILMDKLAGIMINGWEYLFRPDRAFYDPTFNRYVLHEVKTTMYSLNTVAGNLKKTHQTTGYIWGFNRKFYTNVCDVQPEIWYTRGKVYQIERTAPIYRSPHQLNQFSSDLHYWTDELMRKYEDPYEHNFPRCFQCTEGSNFKCDYDEICGAVNIDKAEAPPYGYKMKEDEIK